MYTYEYDNDTGPQDDYFSEYYTILDDQRNSVGRMKTEDMAILVVDLLNKNIGWIGSKVQCGICSHDWVAVFPSTCDALECPNCNNLASFERIK